MKNRSFLQPLFFGSAIVAAVLAAAVSIPAASAQEMERGSPEEAMAMVAAAISLYDEAGRETAFSRFTGSPAPEFKDRDLYIFVLSAEGDIVAHAAMANLIGESILEMEDAAGQPLGEMFVQANSPEGEWVDYVWPNPVSGEVESKSSWVVPHDGLIFGCGVYSERQ